MTPAWHNPWVRLCVLVSLALALLLAGAAGAQPSGLDRIIAGAEELQARAARALDDLLAEAEPPEAPTGLFAFSLNEQGEALKAPLAPDAPLPQHVVLLVHGLDDPGDIWLDLVPGLINAGRTPIAFEYLNDHALSSAADMLGGALRDLRARGVTHADLVCHSMGGLVARDVLTSPGQYAGRADGHESLPDVRRLIMVGTPHAGSALARLRAFAEIREQLVRWGGNGDARQLLGFLSDGLGEAGKDLLPGSAYLTDLNSRPAPTGVEMTCIVGVLAEPPDAADLAWISQAAIVRQLVGPAEAQALAGALRDLTATLGDGCVTVSSATLAGVEDTARVEASHRGMLRRMQIEQVARQAAGEPVHPVPPAVPLILERLSK